MGSLDFFLFLFFVFLPPPRFIFLLCPSPQPGVGRDPLWGWMCSLSGSGCRATSPREKHHLKKNRKKKWFSVWTRRFCWIRGVVGLVLFFFFLAVVFHLFFKGRTESSPLLKSRLHLSQLPVPERWMGAARRRVETKQRGILFCWF